MSKFYGGCDAGSTYTKCVILNEDGKIVADVTKRSRRGRASLFRGA